MVLTMLVNGESAATNTHAVLGIAITSAMFLQSSLGAYAQYGLKADAHRSLHAWLRTAHRWIGRSVLIIALINCRLGIDRLFPDDSSSWSTLRHVLTVSSASGLKRSPAPSVI